MWWRRKCLHEDKRGVQVLICYLPLSAKMACHQLLQLKGSKRMTMASLEGLAKSQDDVISTPRNLGESTMPHIVVSFMVFHLNSRCTH